MGNQLLAATPQISDEYVLMNNLKLSSIIFQ